MIEKALVAFLKGDGPLSNLCSTRIYPEKAPEKSPPAATDLPRITFTRTSTEGIYSQSGVSPLRKATILLECWSTTRLQARQVALVARQAKGKLGVQFDGFAGLMGGFKIQGLFIGTGEIDGYDPPIHADDLGVYSTALELTVWYQELPV